MPAAAPPKWSRQVFRESLGKFTRLKSDQRSSIFRPSPSRSEGVGISDFMGEDINEDERSGWL
jgi:hypothetical protein